MLRNVARFVCDSQVSCCYHWSDWPWCSRPLHRTWLTYMIFVLDITDCFLSTRWNTSMQHCKWLTSRYSKLKARHVRPLIALYRLPTGTARQRGFLSRRFAF